MSEEAKGAPKLTFKERVHIGRDFLRFLQTEGLSVNGMLQTQLRPMYFESYKEYRRQILPDWTLPPLNIIIQTLLKAGHLTIDENKRLFLPIAGALQKLQATEHTNQAGQGRGRRGARTALGPGSFAHSLPAGPPVQFPGLAEAAAAADPDESETGEMTLLPPGKKLGRAAYGRLPPGCIRVDRRKGSNYLCSLCKSLCTSESELQVHMSGKRHRLAFILQNLKTARHLLVEDKEDLKIECPGQKNTRGEYVITVRESHSTELVFVCTNTSTENQVKLSACELLKKVRVFHIHDDKKVADLRKTHILKPGATYTFHVNARANNVGCYMAYIAFSFTNSKAPNKLLHIVRLVTLHCINDVVDQVLSTSVASDKKRKKVSAFIRMNKSYIPGTRPPKSTQDTLVRKLPLKKYHFDMNLVKYANRDLVETKGLNTSQTIEMNSLRKVMEEPPNMENYVKRFGNLLSFEEIQMAVDIQNYDIESHIGICQKSPNLFTLKVPGLAENRPSVLRGDALYVKKEEGGTEFQGIVQSVGMDDVILGFGAEFKQAYLPGMNFKVRFMFNRTPVRLQHRACELALESSLGPTLFPRHDTLETFPRLCQPAERLRWFSTNPEPNREQEQAIRHILMGSSRPAPYIVYGPPGTGKTFTIVEAIKQIHHHVGNACILACTPSNSAADLITKRLKQHIPNHQILRLNAASRQINSVDPAIRDMCNYDKSELVFFPSLQAIMKYRVVVSTLVTSGRLVSANFPSGHFTHLIIDEAGHATEPETIIAVAGLLDINPHIKGGQLVLAGDPKQLGPVLRSRVAINYKLGMSLLERLMLQQNVYQRQKDRNGHLLPYDSRCITKLVKNYRSHPAIMQVSNEAFYDGELEYQADEMMRSQFCRWSELPKQGFPVIFHAVIGRDMREAQSPSFFNAEEVAEVVKYVDLFLSKKQGSGIKHLKPTDIGVIAPYQKQVQKIRTVLGSKGYKEVKVGSVEEFQGQENLIIIVSAVRSQPEYLTMDVKFSLGFLNNFKRFNVAVSRAKALLIVIGNPNMLMMDPYWSQFIKWCHSNGGIQNPKQMPPMDGDLEEELADVLERFHSMQLIGEAESSTENSDVEDVDVLEETGRFNEAAWRSDM